MKRIVIAAILLAFGFSANAQIVGATNNQEVPRTRTSDTSPLDRPTGSYLRFEGGFPIIASVAYCYQFTHSFMIGGGMGYGLSGGYWYSSLNTTVGHPCMPIFIEAEIRTPRFKWSLFFNIKYGYNVFLSNPYDNRSTDDVFYTRILTTSAGVGYKNLSLGCGYSTVLNCNAFISYSLPLDKIKLGLF